MALPQSGCLSLSGNLTPSQTNLSFGNVAIGSSSNQSLTFRNSGTAPSTITKAVASGGGFTVTGPPLLLTLAAGQSTTFMARFAPSAIGSASGSLLITSTQETTPQLTGGSGSATPSIATAQKAIAMAGTGVSAAPSITTQPTSQTVNAGQTATFSVTSSGVAPLSYQWGKNGAAITGATSASYTTPATATSDSGSQFTVVVSNSAGNVTSNAATLTVTASDVAPSITTQPANQKVTVGQTATFSVTASGTSPLNYQWRKNGTTINGATSPSYTTPPTTISEGGSPFTVTVSNSTGSVTSNTATLSVNAATLAPSITTQPASQTVTVGQTATFSVAASGTPLLSNQWRKNGAPITGATSASYTTPATATSDSGSRFTVVVSNSAGSVTSDVATLKVNATAMAPSITTQPTSRTVTAGQTATFSVTSSGTAPLNYQWRKNGAGISGATSASYSTPATATSDSGSQFSVVVSNSTGSVTSNSATLTVDAAPPPPPTQQFYVSPSGNDSDSGTSTSTPWQTIQKAMNSATAGSTVNIMAGTYQEELTMNVSGTSGNYITFQPYNFSVPAGGCGGYTSVACGGDQVILDYTYLGTNTSQTPLFEIGGKSYIRVLGLTFQNFTCFGPLQWGVRIEYGASYIDFDYNKFLNLKNTGPFDGTAWLSPIRIGTGSAANNITFIGNELGNLVTLYSEAITFDGSSATNGLVQDNYIHDTDGNGITTYNGANNITFRHNKLEYITIKRDGTVWYHMLRVAIYIDGGYSDVIERNFVNEAGVGIEALSEPGQVNTHDVTIRNNIVENCNAPGASGIVIGTWYSDTDGSSIYNINIWNNDFYANADGVVIRPMTSVSVSWENNIFANNGTTYVNSLNWNPGTVGYNVYFGGGSGPGSNNLTSDPLFVNASTGNFSLQSTSPAINGGDPLSSITFVGAVDFVGHPRIMGERIDIGAYEVQ